MLGVLSQVLYVGIPNITHLIMKGNSHETLKYLNAFYFLPLYFTNWILSYDNKRGFQEIKRSY